MLRAEIPTYKGDESGGHAEPMVPVLAEIQGGHWLRLILGAEPPRAEDDIRPDICVERRRQGWCIVIAPEGGDASLLIFVHDDGRCFHMGGASVEIRDTKESGVDEPPQKE